MPIGHAYNLAHGTDLRSWSCLAFRFEEDVGFRRDAGESHLLECAGDKFHDRLWKPGWFTGLWRSETGTSYVTDADGALHVVPLHASGDRSRSFDLEGVPTGVWGLNDQHVYIWGRHRHEGFVSFFDGARIHPMASPGLLLWLHGVAPDFLVAVGERGLVSRWDGGRWNRMTGASSALLSSVHVVSPDEMYATGKGREIWDGSVHGWSLRYRHEGPLGAIAKWQDRIWVAAGGDFGLSELVEDRLESRKDTLKSTFLDVRADMLVSCPSLIAATADAEAYLGMGLEGFASLTSSIEPEW